MQGRKLVHFEENTPIPEAIASLEKEVALLKELSEKPYTQRAALACRKEALKVRDMAGDIRKLLLLIEEMVAAK